MKLPFLRLVVLPISDISYSLCGLFLRFDQCYLLYYGFQRYCKADNYSPRSPRGANLYIYMLCISLKNRPD